MSVGEVFGLTVYGMVVGVVLAAPIGPINIEIVLRGVRDGFRSGWLLGLGALTADTLYATLVVSGLTPLADRPALRVPLFLAGAIMLGYVGWGSVRRAVRGDLVKADAKPASRSGKSYVTGFLLAAFNPMGIVYWLSVGAGLVADAVNRVGAIGAPVLVAGVFLGILCWVTGISLVARVSRRFVTGEGMRWVTGVSGAIVVGFALWFLWQAVIGAGVL
ncbi:MAG: LysE family translocator [Thermomicrobiales bacterium]